MANISFNAKHGLSVGTTPPIQVVSDTGAVSATSLSATGALFGTSLVATPDSGGYNNLGIRLRSDSANTSANLTLMPNGTSTYSSLRLHNKDDASGANMGALQLDVNGAAASLNGVSVGSGVAPSTLSIGLTTTITQGLNVSGNVVIGGNLTINGITTTINSTELIVDDINITMGSVASPSDITANGGGITLLGATNKTIVWDSTNTNWTSSEHWNVATGKSFKINNVAVLSNTTLGSTVLASSLTSVGTIATGVWNATIVAGTYGGTGVNNGVKTITLGGNLTTVGAFATTLTSSAATNVTLPTTGTLSTLAGSESLTNKTLSTGCTWNGNTVANAYLTNSTISGIALGSNLNTLSLGVSGTGLSGSASYNGSGAVTFTVASNATSANTASTIVARDASGNFTAGTVSATTFSGAHSGSGAALTSIPNTALNNSSITIGSSAVSLGGTITTIAGVVALTTTTLTVAGRAILTGTSALPELTVHNQGGGINAIFGHQTSETIGGVSGYTQIHNINGDTLSLSRWIANSSGANIRTLKSRSSTLGTRASVTSGDDLFSLSSYGVDSGNVDALATQILSEVDGTVGVGIVPGRLVFYTATSTGTLAEALRLDATQTAIFPGLLTSNSRVIGINSYQTAYSTGGLESKSLTGDVHIALHASGSSATSLKHTRGGNGISIVGTDGTTLANLAAASISGSGLDLSSTFPGVTFRESDAGVDLKNWFMVVDGGNFTLRTRTDAYADILNTILITRAGNLTAAGTITATSSVSGTQLIVTGGGTIGAGSIYSDVNWGMILRAKQAAPLIADFSFQNSVGTACLTLTTTTANFPGSITATNGAFSAGIIGSQANGGLELGSYSVSNTPFIDFHSSGTSIDYDARIIASGGTGSVGQGSLNVYAAGGVTFNGNTTINNGAADGGFLHLASQGYNTWSINNSSGLLRFVNNGIVPHSFGTDGTVRHSGGRAATQIEIVAGTGSTWYKSVLRTDTNAFYYLLSNVQATQGAADGASFNSLRPLAISNTTGFVTMSCGLNVTTPTNSILYSEGLSGYGALYSKSSNANESYHFFGNVSNGETGRLTSVANYFAISANPGTTPNIRINNGSFTILQNVNGAYGTVFGNDTIPIVSNNGFIGYTGLAVIPNRWGNNTPTVDAHTALYQAGSQRNVGALVTSQVFANWGYFTNNGATAGGLGNATAQAEAVSFKWEHTDSGSQFNQKLKLSTQTSSGVWSTAIEVNSSGIVTVRGISPTSSVPVGYALSTNGTATVAVGSGNSLTNDLAAIMGTNSLNKTTSAWTVGSGQGGLDTGTIALNWYNFYAIRRPDTGVCDIIFSLNATSPTLPTNYTQYRYIGSRYFNGSVWPAATQYGHDVYWSTPVLDFAGTGAATASTLTCSIPRAIRGVKGNFNVSAAGGVGQIIYISDLSSADLAPSFTASPGTDLGSGSGNTHASNVSCWANSSGQIRHREVNTGMIYIITRGWTDLRSGTGINA